MLIIDGTILSKYAEENSKEFQSLLPELVKRLILSSCPDIKNIRIPGMNDIWAPGFDGVIENHQGFKYVCSGLSVWEFGASGNPLKKVNDDYAKRTNNSLGIDKKTAEFYLVVPYIWAFNTTISKWESEHSDWKAVHVFDASVLADWLNAEPNVLAWLLEQLEKSDDLDFCCVSHAWHRFASKTNPSFSTSLFLNGRDEEIKIFVDHLQERKTVVKADTTIDAYGFCLSVLLTNPDLLNTVIVIDNYKTYKFLSRLCQNKVFLLNFKIDEDILDKNYNIICFNKEDRSIQADTNLRPLSKILFDKSIRDMGLSERQVNDLYNQTHGNLLSLIRKIPGNATDSCPKWASQDRIILLAPLLLLQNYNTQNEYDRKLVEFIANEKYEYIEEKYKAWVELEDAPLKQVEGFFVLNNYEETWDVLRISALSPIFNRYAKALIDILSIKDYSDHGELLISDYQSKRHLHYLFLNLIYFSGESDNIAIIEKTVSSIITILPASSFIEHLSLLSEAVPSIIMDYLITDYESDAGIIKKLFIDDTYLSDYCKILFAIDELVLHEETRIKACDLLFELCIITQHHEFKISNSPRESLLNALCLWSDHTILSVNDKVQLVEKYMRKDPDYISVFAADLLLMQHLSFGIRCGSKFLPKMVIYENELLSAKNRIASIVFQYCIENKKINVVKNLLVGYSHFYFKTLIDAADLFDSGAYGINELLPLNHELRFQAYYAFQNDITVRWIPALNKWIEITTPTGEIGSISWLFYDYYSCKLPATGLDTEDWSEDFKRLNDYRNNTIKMLIDTNSTTNLIQLICLSKDSFEWGCFYADHLSGRLCLDVAQALLKCGKCILLCGLINRVKIDDCISFLETVPEEQLLFFLKNINRRDIVGFLDMPQKELSYWSHQAMRDHDEESYEKLLKFNPSSILPYYAYLSKTPFTLEEDRIKRALNAIIDWRKSNPINEIDALERILEKAFQDGLYSEEWAEICIKLYCPNSFRKYPSMLKLYYFIHPNQLCERIKSANSDAYAEFNFYYELPEIAYKDEIAFSFFATTIMNEHNEDDLLLTIFGSILGRSQKGEDGIFPHEFVRSFIEQSNNNELIREILIGKLNSRGARIVLDGTEEKTISEQYYSDAKRIEISYPETAILLRRLGDEYAADSKRDRLYAEIGGF